MSSNAAPAPLCASRLSLAVWTLFAALLAMLLDVLVFAPGRAALVAGVFALPVLAQRRCVALVLALAAMVSVHVMLAVCASSTWFAPILVDAVLAVGVHG